MESGEAIITRIPSRRRRALRDMDIRTPPKAPVTFENCATALGTLPVKDKALKVRSLS